MIEDTIDDMKKAMNKAIDSLRRELAKVRTGRASTALLDSIVVDYYGTMTPVNQMATVSVPESRLVTIQPWDATAIEAIEKAILTSDLGLNPNNDGKLIRLSIPPLTEETRRDMVKLAKKFAEDSRISVRNARRDANDLLKSLEKEKEISEDELKRAQDEVQKITDEYIKNVDSIIKNKETDIMEI
ncbi:MAG: ribosome recycling factor [Deltaproteobacteria bacterium]|nr:ribosome recycling factor [Deltaproteobacteria bacterium]